jgi:hypothetical protein
MIDFRGCLRNSCIGEKHKRFSPSVDVNIRRSWSDPSSNPYCAYRSVFLSETQLPIEMWNRTRLPGRRGTEFAGLRLAERRFHGSVARLRLSQS